MKPPTQFEKMRHNRARQQEISRQLLKADFERRQHEIKREIQVEFLRAVQASWGDQ